MNTTSPDRHNQNAALVVHQSQSFSGPLPHPDVLKKFDEIAIVGLIVAALIAIYGSAIAGGIIGVGTLASLVGVFMYGSSTRSKERVEKKTE